MVSIRFPTKLLSVYSTEAGRVSGGIIEKNASYSELLNIVAS